MTRHFRRRPRPAAVIGLLILTLAIVRVGNQFLIRDEPGDLLREGACRVVRVVDGDTLIVQQGASKRAGKPVNVRLRLLGMDTPETVKPNHPVEPWGPEATEFTIQFLRGRQVHLQLDRRRRDRYGRYLAYVFVDDTMLNEELVRAGLARVTIYRGDSPHFERRLRRAAEEARQNRRGIWSDR